MVAGTWLVLEDLSSVQFKLYQGEVFPYNPGTRDWVESTQSETTEGPFLMMMLFSLSVDYSDDDDVYSDDDDLYYYNC